MSFLCYILFELFSLNTIQIFSLQVIPGIVCYYNTKKINVTDARGMCGTCLKLTERHHNDVTYVAQYHLLLIVTFKKNFAHHSSLISGLYWTSISLITQQRYLVFQDVFKTSWRCLQCNIFLFFKTSSRHVCQTSSNNVF